MKNLSLTRVVLLLIIFTGCTVIKRQYLPGYYIDLKSKNVEKEASVGKFPVVNDYMNKIPLTSESIQQNQEINEIKQNVIYDYNLKRSNDYDILVSNTSYNGIRYTFTISRTEVFKSIQKSLNNKTMYLPECKVIKKKGGEKDQIIALLLCLFLGMLGIHSFYLGNKRKGIIQLVMFCVGLFTFWFFIGYLIWLALGIWVFVDFIRIVIGDLGPGW
ncbi:MAG: NINE protein [Bacteroidales bacterium]|nr:NINE protein [Bacteroidales bacterium]